MIILVWVVFIFTAGLLSMALQRANIYENSKKELINQAEIISRQFENIVDTHFNSRAVLYGRQLSELKAISFALEGYDDIDEARAFLNDVVTTTEIQNLWIADRNGNIIYSHGSAPAPDDLQNPDQVASVLDSRAYEQIEGTFTSDDRYQAITYILEEDRNGLVWGVKNKWVVYAESVFTEKLKEAEQFFNWDHVLQTISIGGEGEVLAVSETDGCVLSYSDDSAKGKPVEDLNIIISGDNSAASVDRLKDEFSDPKTVKEIRVGSNRYFATRIKTDKDFFLAMIPRSMMQKEAARETIILLLHVIAITAVGVIYVFCFAGKNPAPSKDQSGKGDWGFSIGRLKLLSIMAVILVLITSLYLETHLVYAKMFQYTSTTAEDVLQKKTDSDKMLKEIQKGVQAGNLEKCKIAKFVIQHAPAGRVDREFVSDLADRLSAKAIYVFDKDGKVAVTNAPYDGDIINNDSPFMPLLKGTESVVVPLQAEGVSQDVHQEVGVTMIDQNNLVQGAVVLKDSTVSMLSDSLSYEAVFQRVFLRDNTVVMAVNNQDMTVQYFAQVDGSFLVSDRLAFDYKQVDATALGMDKDLIRDHFNGEMFAIDNKYFSSVRRSDNAFLMVLRPLVFFDSAVLLPVCIAGASALVFFILLILMTRKLQNAGTFDSDGSQEEASEPKKDKDAPTDNNNEDDVISLIKTLVAQKRPYFEERWPSDGKKWKEKTPEDKFSFVVKLVFVAALAFILVQALVEGRNSIWYYCFSAEWSTGINLYSITTCIITILLLLLLKEVIHKVLYFIARSSTGRRGESICHLLNSFSGYVLFFVGIFLVLSTFGVNVMAMSLTAGVAGVIFGIGCQNTVADIIAGILMVFEGVACAGDFVSYNGKFGVITTIGVRMTKLKWYSETTIIRNNEFKNFVSMPGDARARVILKLSVDLKESMEKIEGIIDRELPQIRDNIAAVAGEDIKLKYRGVNNIESNGIQLSFALYCKGMYFGWARRLLNRELLLMCERNGLRLAMPQVVINERES